MKSCLIVEDDSISAESCAEIIRDLGFECHIVEDAETASKTFQHEEWALFLIDIRLPGRSGLELLGDIRETSDAPVIMLSDSSNPGVIALCFDAGATDFIRKPIEPVELYCRVRKALRHS